MNDLVLLGRMSTVAATLGNASRLLLLQLIAAGEKSVETLSELSGIPVASTSQQLQVLKKSDMVVTRREGKYVLYRLQNGPIRELIDALERFAVFRGLKRGQGAETDEGISPAELQKKLNKSKVVLIDVRSRNEYDKGHIAGAVCIPFEELKKQAGKLPQDRELIVYCRGPNCVLSVNALAVLSSRGISALRLTSGFSEWPGERSAAREH